MKAPLSLALAALCASALAQDKPETPASHSLTEVACGQNGTGALLRYTGKEGRDEFEGSESDTEGLEPVAEKAMAAPKSKSKSAPKPAKPKTYRLKAGDGCEDRLKRLTGRPSRGGENGGDFSIVPDEPGMTTAKIEAAFKKAATLNRLNKMSFESPTALSGLYDNALSRNPKISREAAALLRAAPGASADALGSGIVRADGTFLKPDMNGKGVGEFKPLGPSVKAKAPPPDAPTSLDSSETDPKDYSSHAPVRFFQQNVLDPINNGVIQPVEQKVTTAWNGAIADNRPFTLTPGEVAGIPQLPPGAWVELPRSGPGFRFVGRGDWGREYVLRGLMRTTADPIVNVGGGMTGPGPFGIVAISLPQGGKFPPHVTHREGWDIDVALWGYHGGPLNTKAADRNLMFAVSAVENMKPTFILLDNQRQAELAARAKFLVNDPNLDAALKARIAAAATILFERTPGPRGRKLFSHVENHKDHFHVEMRSGRLGE